MTLVLPNNTGIVTLMWRYVPLGRDMSITFGFNDNGASGNANAAAGSWRNALTAAGAPAEASQMTTNWQQTGARVLMRDNAGLLINGVDVTVLNGTAGASSDTQPIYSPLVVSKFTAFAGKHYRGRCYPPVTLLLETAFGAGGEIPGATQAALQVRWSSFLAAINATTYPARLLHDPVVPVTPTPTAISSLFVRPVLGIQRRRRTRGA